MPEYLYRREDGSTFTVRQKFSDDPLTSDPETGQGVVRVIQPTGIIFKGSGFYVNDSKNASKKNLSTHSNGSEASSNGSSEASASSNGSNDSSSNGSGGTVDSKPAVDTSASSSPASRSDVAAS